MPIRPLILLLIAAAFLPLACVKLPVAKPPDPTSIDVPDFEELVPGNRPPASGDSGTPAPVSGFEQELASQGIALSTLEKQQLAQMESVQPNGSWAASQTRSESENLRFNFQRFGGQIRPRPATAEEYRAQAIAFARKPGVPLYLDVQYYQARKQLLVAKWDSLSGEFVILRPDGTLVNYLISRSVGPPRYLRIE